MVQVAISEAGRIVEIEVRGEHNSQLLFRPIGRGLRGYADFSSSKSQSDLALRNTWPDPIPGKIIGVDLDSGEKYVREPLHEKANSKLQTLIRSRGKELEGEREVFVSHSVITWLYWMRRAVDAGLARIVVGELPPADSFEGERKLVANPNRPQKNFILAEQEPHDDRLAVAMERVGDLLERVLTKIGK